MSKGKIEILTVTHKPAFFPENGLLKPIQVGASLSGNKLEGMTYYDNEGDNISDKNGSYCELTAVYWAWKNLESDYYGLFHYRRYLSFAEDGESSEYAGRAYPDIPTALQHINLDEKCMREIIEANDFIVPRKESISATTKYSSIYEQYGDEHFIGDLDYCLAYIGEKYPGISKYVNVLSLDKGYFCNMFIMRRDIFNEYSSFIFDVLGHFESNHDLSNYSAQQYRVMGYIAERLTDVFIHYLIGQGKYRYKELQIAFFENTSPSQELQPMAENSVNIALAADNYYVPYVSTLIRSVRDNMDSRRVYDIVIFHRDITSENRDALLGEASDDENVSIRFCDMSYRMNEYSHLATKWHITIETYFRLFIPEIMRKYNKVLYLDGDMIVKRDVSGLFDEDIDDYMIAACRDVDMAGVYNSNLISSENTIDPERKDYIDNIIKLNSPYDYFQAGMLLMNLDKIRGKYTTRDFLNLASSRKWVYMDQDILNHSLRGCVKYLSLKWNVLYDWEFVRIKDVISKAPVGIYGEYMESRKNPYIIHYGGSVKPWQRADADFATHFWIIARESVFYEVILSRMSRWALSDKLTQEPAVRLVTKVARKLRSGADVVMPVGTRRRKPVTYASRVIKKIIY